MAKNLHWLIFSFLLFSAAIGAGYAVAVVDSSKKDPQPINGGGGEDVVLAPGIAVGEKFHYLYVDGKLVHLKSPLMGELLITKIEGKWVRTKRIDNKRNVDAEYWINWDNVSFYTTEKMKYNQYAYESDVDKSPLKLKKED